MYPKREGIDAGSGEGQASLPPPPSDPMAEQTQAIRDNTTLLQRILTTLENRAAENDAIWYVPPGKQDGTIKAAMPPRFRLKFIVVMPVGTGEPMITIGTQSFSLGSIQAIPVPIVIPFPRVFQEGVDVFLWNNSAPTVVPAFLVYLIGTTE